MSQRPDSPKRVIPFAPAEKPWLPTDRDPMDRSGDAIVALLDRAAVLSNDECDRAMALARHLSAKLQAAEERATQLQAQLTYFHDRAMRAESWLARIHHEIKDKLLNRGAADKGTQSAPAWGTQSAQV